MSRSNGYMKQLKLHSSPLLQRISHWRKKVTTVVIINRSFSPEFNAYHNKDRILHVTKKRKAAAARVEGQHEPVMFLSLEPNNWKNMMVC